jgi:MPBQ/MSBQ methyltransferase
MSAPRLIQRKTEARWFYKVVSQGYDGWINPLFWTAPMRDAALRLARLDRDDLEVADVGAGTGFGTQGIVRHVAPARVTMVDQSPDQLAKARRKPDLAAVTKRLGDAEDLPLETDRFDRYVSTGSIEYWPDPQRAVAEAYRVLKPGGVAMLAGPLARTHPLARRLSDTWMLFPTEREYRDWFARAGFSEIRTVHAAPAWWRDGWDPYAVAVSGVKPAAGPSPLGLGPLDAPAAEALTPARLARFATGSLAGAAFIPVALWFTAIDRLRHRR